MSAPAVVFFPGEPRSQIQPSNQDVAAAVHAKLRTCEETANEDHRIKACCDVCVCVQGQAMAAA